MGASLRPAVAGSRQAGMPESWHRKRRGGLVGMGCCRREEVRQQRQGGQKGGGDIQSEAWTVEKRRRQAWRQVQALVVMVKTQEGGERE